MKLSLTVKVPKGLDFSEIWDKVDTEATGNDGVFLIRARTQRGIDANGKPFKAYSTNGPIWISLDAGSGNTLTPKGGELSASGRSMKFKNYAHYKRLSRKRGGGSPYALGETAEVDLTRSGLLMNNLRVRSATDDSVLIGVGDQVASYAGPVNDLREYMGLTREDLDTLVEGIAERIAENIAAAWGRS